MSEQEAEEEEEVNRLWLRNMVEELESDHNQAGAYVYDTFHRAEQGRVGVDHRKRSRSWSE